MGIRVTVRSRWDEGDEREGALGGAPTGGSLPMYAFDQGRVRVGRAAGSDIQLPHPAVSVLHASLAPSGAGYTVTDEDSTNGVYVNGERIAPKRAKSLRTGDRIELGGFVLRVELTPLVATATSALETSALARRLVRGVLAGGATPVGAPSLTVENGPNAGARFEIPAAPCSLRVGRGEACEVRLDDGDVSREHAEIVRDLDGVVFRELDAKNASLVNGRSTTTRRLVDRDRIQVGATLLTFEDPAAMALERVQSAPDRALDVPPEGPEDWDAVERLSSGGEGGAKDAVEDDADEGAGSNGEGDSFEPGDEEPWHGPSSAPEDVALASPPPEPDAPRRRRPRPPQPAAPASDMLVYILAAIVLGASAFGLYWLMNAG